MTRSRETAADTFFRLRRALIRFSCACFVASPSDGKDERDAVKVVAREVERDRILVLICRRRTTGPVMATIRNDKAMYVLRLAAIVTGLVTTLLGASGGEATTTGSPSPRGSARWSSANPTRGDGRRRARVPGPRPDRDVPVRVLAVHPAGARLQHAATADPAWEHREVVGSR
jgi:hypothetical protein